MGLFGGTWLALPYPARGMASSVLPSKERVNKAGRRIAKWLDGEAVLSEDELQELVVPVLQWRAQHTYPMSLAMPSLRKWAERYSTSDVQPSQRLKVECVQLLFRQAGEGHPVRAIEQITEALPHHARKSAAATVESQRAGAR